MMEKAVTRKSLFTIDEKCKIGWNSNNDRENVDYRSCEFTMLAACEEEYCSLMAFAIDRMGVIELTT